MTEENIQGLDAHQEQIKVTKSEEIAVTTTYKAVDEEQRLVTGVVLAPNDVDAHGDVYDEEEVRKAAHDFAVNGFYEQAPALGIQHLKKTRDALIVESYLAPTDMELNGVEIKKGTWMITTKVLSDPLWKAVKEGTFTGFSIGGTAQVEELE